MKNIYRIFISASALLALLPLQAATINVLSADAQLRNDGSISISGTTAASGVSYKNPIYVAVIALPELDEGTEFSTADFSLMSQRYGSVTFNGDLYGLGYRTSSAVVAGDYYKGTLDATETLIQDNFLDSSMSINYINYHTSDTGDTALTDYLNAQYTASAADRLNGDDIYVFLRVSPDTGATGGSYRYFNIKTAENSGTSPMLTYETAAIPEAGTLSLLVVSGIVLVLFQRKRG
ncbi:hypothetical protein P0Y35_04655 [Kiritimatiellaeota bacterium B1221]|nr:hypothetical protein [Kiritimatiellaeota bacterium B1221]